MRHFCPHCLRETETHVEQLTESYPVLGEESEVQANVRVCGCCGESIWDGALDGTTLERAYAWYRVKHGLPPGSDIRASLSFCRKAP